MKFTTSVLVFTILPFVAAIGMEGGVAASADHSDATTTTTLEMTARLGGGIRKSSARRKLMELTGPELLAFCQATPAANCCNGPNACDFQGTYFSSYDPANPMPLNLCNGKNACKDMVKAPLGTNVCNGDNSCRNSDSQIFSEACNGKDACNGVKGSLVNLKSCNGRGACKGSAIAIYFTTCNGPEACQGSSTGDFIDNFACNSKGACKKSTATIGQRSCNALRICKEKSGTIGDDACNDADGSCP